MGEGDVGQVSADGKWFWDGKQWASTLSSDGKWRWDGRLHLEHDNQPGETKAAEVKWNGPDEFVGTADGMPVTFRRKAKP